MHVHQVIELAREWVELHGSQIPEFCGAYLFGGVTSLPKDATFPSYRDVDLIVVLKSGPKSEEENLELPYKGVVLEVGFRGLEEHLNSQAVLSSPELAPNLAFTTVLADPMSILKPLHEEVAKQFAHRRWVLARCEVEKQQVLDSLEAMDQAPVSLLRLIHLWLVIRNLSGLLAIATLKPPTNRRALALMKELLQAQGRLELHEEALEVCGVAHLSRAQVEGLLKDMALAFDRAVEVKKTPAMHSWKIQPHLRPYVVEGNQEMISEGHYREAVFWIALPHATANFVLQNDAPEAGKSLFQDSFDHLLDHLDLRMPRNWPGRVQCARNLAQKIFQIADNLAALHPE